MTPPPLPEDLPCETATLDASGLRLHVRVWGDQDKPAVLLQHGGLDHGRSWDWTVAGLADRYCCLVPDLRGHGCSDWSTGGGYRGEDYVADMALIGAWAAARWSTPLPVVGHSLGGNIALRYAAAFPERVRRVVCLEGLGFSADRYAEMMAVPPAERLRRATDKRLMLLGGGRRFATVEDGVARLARLHPHLAPEVAEHLGRHALREDEGAWVWRYDPLLRALPMRPEAPAEYLPLYSAISCPVLLMYGEDSWASDPGEDGRTAAFADARLVRYAGAGHWLHHDAFGSFLSDLRGFLGEA